MRKYLGVKSFTSLLTAVLSFVILEGVQLDFALFWAFIIFLFNYIPTVGSITATALPALTAISSRLDELIRASCPPGGALA